MRKNIQRALSLLALFGVDPRKTAQSLAGLPSFIRDFIRLRAQEPAAARRFPRGKFYPCIADREAEGGTARGQYFHQDLLVARRVHENQAERHVDVGSRVDGFIAHVASFRPIEVFDIRPISEKVQNIRFLQADLMAPVPEQWVNYCDSLSCLHALEHFGLGRYGDPVSYDGYLRGLANLWLILRKGGKLYLSVPIGPERLEFNAHRIFSVAYLLACFSGKYEIDRFSYIDDVGDVHENSPLTDELVATNFGCYSGCGIFEMTKL